MTSAAYRPAGLHLLADLYGVGEDKLSQADTIEHLLLQSAQAAGARILHSRFHSFGPGKGITGVVLLAESHISIHTWPEFGFAAADIFMCGEAQPQRALQVIQLALQPASCTVQTILRGDACRHLGAAAAWLPSPAGGRGAGGEGDCQDNLRGKVIG